MPKAYKTVGLMDHMGLGNMGDAAIQESFIANLRQRLPGVHLINWSLYPEDTRARHHIESYPIRWSYPGWKAAGGQQGDNVTGRTQRFKNALKNQPILHKLGKPLHDASRELAHLRRSYRLIKSLDLLVMAGGGQLCELWQDLPYNVFKFCVLAKLARTPVIFVGVGADLLKRPSNKFFAKCAVRLADYVSLRSAESLALVRSLGVKREIRVCPDPVYGLDLQDYISSDRSKMLSTTDGQALLRNLGCELPFLVSAPTKGANGLARKVGLNPMGFCDPRRWPRKDSALYSKYLDKLEGFICWLLENKYEVEVFSSDVVGDVYAMEDLRSRLLSRPMADGTAAISFRPMLTLRELLLQMSTFDYVVTCKFHGVVFSHMLGKPVLALSYLPKMDDLMRTVGHDQYCLDVEHFELPSLIERFKSLVEEQDRLRPLFQGTTATYREALQCHFDELFGDAGGLNDHAMDYRETTKPAVCQ